MEDILIEKTSKTPAVNFSFSEGTLEIRGVSIPEDADNFYAPLLEWVNDYIDNKTTDTTRVILKLIYFNTSTSDYLVSMLKNLKKLVKEEKESFDEENELEEITQNGSAEVENTTELDDEVEPAEPEHKLIIEWHYEEDDEDMRETGSHFESIIDMPFTFYAVEEIA